MASDEAGLWGWLRDVVLPIGHYSRIESPETAPGFPDVDYVIDGRMGKIELKHSLGRINLPFPNADQGIHLSQKIWIREAIRNDCTVWIFAEITPEVLIIPGSRAGLINKANRAQLNAITQVTLNINEPAEAADILKELL